jgi:hypothetical protein
MRFFPNQSVVSKAVPQLGEDGFSAVAWLRSDIHGNILSTFDSTKSQGFNWGIINGRASFQGPGRGRVQPDHPHTRYARWSLLGLTVDIKNHEVRFFSDGAQVGRRPLPSLSASAARGHRATVCGPANGNPGMLGEIRYLALVPSPMNTEEHRSFYNAFARELNLSEAEGATAAPMKTPSLEFNPAEPESLAGEFDFPPDIKAGLVESASSDNRRVLRFHGEIAAGLDLDHQSRSRGDRVSLRFRFKHLSGDRYVIGTIGDARVPVRLVHEGGTIYLCGENTREACGPLAPGWNTISVETGGKTTTASLNGAAAKQATHEPKGTWVYLGQGYREGTYPVDSAFEMDVSSVGTRVQAGRR